MREPFDVGQSLFELGVDLERSPRGVHRDQPRILWLALLLPLLAGAARAQDHDWVRMWEEMQRARPRVLTSTARIAPANEPGTPLTVNGRILQRDGRTPAANVIVFAYHTDATGVYNQRGVRGWRLRGWARTDANGRFVLRTIRPAPYPRGSEPAHIHFTLEGPGLPRRSTKDLQFSTGSNERTVKYVARITEEGRF